MGAGRSARPKQGSTGGKSGAVAVPARLPCLKRILLLTRRQRRRTRLRTRQEQLLSPTQEGRGRRTGPQSWECTAGRGRQGRPQAAEDGRGQLKVQVREPQRRWRMHVKRPRAGRLQGPGPRRQEGRGGARRGRSKGSSGGQAAAEVDWRGLLGRAVPGEFEGGIREVRGSPHRWHTIKFSI